MATTPSFSSGSPIVGGLDPGLLEAQRAVNAQLALMPQLDITTPDGLAVLRAMTTPWALLWPVPPSTVPPAGSTRC